MYEQLSTRLELLGKEVVDVAFKVHKELGPGLLESVYERCFCYELTRRDIEYTSQQYIDIVYDGALLVEKGLKVDILVEEAIVVELKAQEIAHSIWQAQLLSYLRLCNKKLGYLINFHVPLIKNGIKRVIL